jgi:hypothetical protein
LDTITRFGKQELGIGSTSLKMVEEHLEGDRDADVVFTTLWARPDA